jgi:hypothetical protein
MCKLLIAIIVRIVYLALKTCQVLYERNQKKKKTEVIEFIQKPKNGLLVVYPDGTPVDRDGWLYLPWMSKYSRKFQPQSRMGEGYIYRKTVEELKSNLLEVRKDGLVLKKIKVNDNYSNCAHNLIKIE